MANDARVTTTATSGAATHPPTAHGRAGARIGLALGAALAASATAIALSVPAAVAQAAPRSTTTLLSLQGSTFTPSAAAQWVAAHGGRVLETYAVADALLVSLPEGTAAPAGVQAVADVPLRVNSAATAVPTAADVKGATYRSTIAAPGAALGAGVTVAVVDTGVADVPDLAGRLTHVNVSGGGAGDGLGHGTFMAGLVAGDGTSSGGVYTGVAPQARVLDVQVATSDGSTSLSRVLAGLQAVADAAATDSSVKVLSLALSTGSPLPPSADPLARALDRLWAAGITVVTAAGNDGPDGVVSSPGSDRTIITVGALDERGTSDRSDDVVASFSSRSKGKPDLVAPGVSLVSLRSPGSIADLGNPGSRVLDSYFTGSGTSMSEAVTAGAVAAVISSRPSLDPTTVKSILTSTAYSSRTLQKKDGAGAGALDLAAAVDAAATAKPVRDRGDSDARGAFAPSTADSAAWAAFAQAWAAGDLDGVAAAWSQMSPQTRRWAANAFALEMVSQNVGASSDDFAAIESLARAWTTQGWQARAWADDDFVARAWTARAWTARAWTARAWTLQDWAARAWTDSGWSARAWTDANWSARAWTNGPWAARAWTQEAWDARAWTQDAWSARAWTSSDFLAFAWVARAWTSSDWAARAWTDSSWSARAWTARAWTGWSWEARAWSARAWTSDAWADAAWTPAA